MCTMLIHLGISGKVSLICECHFQRKFFLTHVQHDVREVHSLLCVNRLQGLLRAHTVRVERVIVEGVPCSALGDTTSSHHIMDTHVWAHSNEGRYAGRSVGCHPGEFALLTVKLSHPSQTHDVLLYRAYVRSSLQWMHSAVLSHCFTQVSRRCTQC